MREALTPVISDPSQRVFLKDVGTVCFSQDGIDFFHLDKLADHPKFAGRNIPKKGWFCANFSAGGIGQELLLSRHVCGDAKRNMIAQTTQQMQRILHSFLAFPLPFCQVPILWGGLAQNLFGVDPPIIERSIEVINTVFIRKKRIKDPSKPRGWDIKKTVMIEEWFPCPTYLIMEECIASGNSVISVLTDMIEDLKQKNSLPKYIVLTPVCASLEGVEAIYTYLQKVGINLIVVFNSAIIEISKEGVDPDLPYTDLSLNDLTITSERLFHALRERYKETRICMVGDMGRSIHKPVKFAYETFCDMVSLGWDPRKEDWTKWDLSILSSSEFIQLISEDPRVYMFYREIIPLLDALKEMHWQRSKHLPPEILKSFPFLERKISPDELLNGKK